MWAQLEHRIFIAEARTRQKHWNVQRSAGAKSGTDPLATQVVFRSGRDMYLPVELALSETAFGCVRKVTFDTKVACESCSELSAENSRRCPACQGARRVPVRRRITVRSPAGVEHETLIQISGEGDVDRS